MKHSKAGIDLCFEADIEKEAEATETAEAEQEEARTRSKKQKQKETEAGICKKQKQQKQGFANWVQNLRFFAEVRRQKAPVSRVLLSRVSSLQRNDFERFLWTGHRENRRKS